MPTLDKVTSTSWSLGTTSMPVHQVMRLSRGAIIELDTTETDEVKILANNLPVASGAVLVNRNRIAVEVKRMLPKSRAPGRPTFRGMPEHDVNFQILFCRGLMTPPAALVPPLPICYMPPVDPVLTGSGPTCADLKNSGRGGIGRRATLRWQRSKKSWGFEYLRAHQLKKFDCKYSAADRAQRPQVIGPQAMSVTL